MKIDAPVESHLVKVRTFYTVFCATSRWRRRNAKDKGKMRGVGMAKILLLLIP